MRKCRFSNDQIVFALKQKESGVSIDKVCQMLGISERTFYRWKSVYGGLIPGDINRVKRLENENVKLKKLVADLSLEKAILQDQLDQKRNEIWAFTKQQSHIQT